MHGLWSRAKPPPFWVKQRLKYHSSCAGLFIPWGFGAWQVEASVGRNKLTWLLRLIWNVSRLLSSSLHTLRVGLQSIKVEAFSHYYIINKWISTSLKDDASFQKPFLLLCQQLLCCESRFRMHEQSFNSLNETRSACRKTEAKVQGLSFYSQKSTCGRTRLSLPLEDALGKAFCSWREGKRPTDKISSSLKGNSI